MFHPVTVKTQEDRFKQHGEAKSCLTLDSPHSDNGSLRLGRRRKSFCGLQLDGFFGAIPSSLRANVELVDVLWSGAIFPRAADQTDLPVIADLCVQPCFRIWKHRAPRIHFAQPASWGDFASLVFTSTDWSIRSSCRSSAALRHESKVCI
jgi:hypothetical protein